jgi:hypothetical protein
MLKNTKALLKCFAKRLSAHVFQSGSIRGSGARQCIYVICNQQKIKYMKRMNCIIVILIGVFIGMSKNSKATMVMTDPGPTSHYSQYSDRGLRGKVINNELLKEIKTDEQIVFTAGSEKRINEGWTRYLIVSIMFIVLIKFWIAEIARRKANKITKYLVLHAMHFNLDYQLASLIYQRNYLDETGPKQLFFLFSYKQLISKDDLKSYKKIQHDINQSSIKKSFDKTNWQEIRNSLHIQGI